MLIETISRSLMVWCFVMLFVFLAPSPHSTVTSYELIRPIQLPRQRQPLKRSLFPLTNGLQSKKFLQTSSIWMTAEGNTAPPPFVRPVTNENDYNAFIKDNTNGGIVVVEFQKGNCKPCKKVGPLYEALAEKYNDRAVFYRMDADFGKETLQAMKKVGVKSVPTFFVFRNGERVDSISGARVDDLETLIKQELTKQ